MEAPQPKSLELDVISSGTIPNTILRECFGAEPKESQCTQLANSTLGIAGCYEYHCSFDLPKSLDKFFYVVDRFCKNFEGDAHIGADLLFTDLFDTIEMDHKYVKVDHFALGAWTGLSGFIEKFSSARARTPPRSISRIECSFHHNRRFLELHFEDKIHLQKAISPAYKLTIAYDDIKKIVLKRELRHRDAFYEVNRKKEPTDVFLHVSRITAFSWHDPERNAFDEFFDGEWDRSPNFGALGGVTYCGVVGASSVFKFKLDSSVGYPNEAIYALLRAADVPVFFANVKTHEMPKNIQPLTCDKSSSEVQCLLACIHSLAPELSMKIALDQNNKEIQQLLTKLAAKNDSALVAALYDIYHTIQKHSVFDTKLAIEDAFKKAESGMNSRNVVTKTDLPKNHYLVKKVTVCPSKIIVEPPVAVRVNVLLHDFDPEKVMLVDIRDDDRRMLRLRNSDEARTFIQTAIAERIKKGIKLAGKTYYFLGNSKSQMEECSFWAYAIDKKGPDTISSIRQQLGIEGDLAARVAVQDLVFAEALGCTEISPEWVVEEDETPSADSKLGIGRISRDALYSIVDQCYPIGHPCAAIRVVHQGRKGTLVYDPSLDGNQIVYRKSQTVFASEDQTLYLIGTNELREAVFDKVFITTLSSKLDGHKEEFSAKHFITPVYELLSDSVSPFLCGPPGNTLASEPVLQHIIQKQPSRRYDRKGDGLFRQAIRCKHLKALRALKMLKEPVKGAYELMPVVDECGVLEEDEVFIQLTQPGAEYNVLSSPLVIARKDAMHPSELLRVTAVNRPEVVSKLGHLSNCVVMPAKGSSKNFAPLSREASYAEGSNVIVIANREPSFLFKRNDKPQPTKVSMGKAVDPTCDLESHYFNYIKYASYNDFEEVFCALSDSLPQHAYTETCNRVAMQRRLLEEYRRGGRELGDLQKISCFPDFLEKISDRKTYCSARPLGHVFRKVRYLDTGFFESVDMKYDCITAQNELLLGESEKYDEDAVKEISIFKRRLEGIASLYQISVDEVLTGTIFALPADRFSDERTRSLEATVKLHVQHLAALCRRQFKRATKKASEEDVLLRISAYYHASRAYPTKGGYAFPWMFPDLMQTLIKTCKPKPPPISESGIIEKLLKNAKSEDEEVVRLAIMTNMFGILQKWLEVNKKVCAFSRGDANYYSATVTEYETQAFEKAVEIFNRVGSSEEVAYRMRRDPSPLLAETLRQMMLVFAKVADEKFSERQFTTMHIQTLLLNTLIRIAATSSLGVLLRPKKILRNLIVTRRMLLPLDNKDYKYIRDTHNELHKFQASLCEFSSCERVTVNTLPQGGTLECDYEEIIANGPWFAVTNLEYVIMQPDFRKTVLEQFAKDRVRNQNREANQNL